MDENINVVNENEDVATNNEKQGDEFKKKVEDVVEKIRTQALLLGGKTMATIVYNKIQAAINAPGKRTMNDYRRLIKDIETFCKKAVEHDVATPQFDETEQ